MSTIENMIENEMIQDVMETVVEVKPATNFKGAAKNGLAAIAVVAIWEGGKFAFGKAKKFVQAKKAAKNEAEIFEDQDVVDVEVK